VASAAASIEGIFVFQSAADPSLHMRHCDFNLFAVNVEITPAQDFNFTVAPGVRGAQPCVRAASSAI
jgi:hypothetical protein